MENDMYKFTENAIIYEGSGDTVKIEAWGRGIRVRIVPSGEIPDEAWALDYVAPQNATVYMPERGAGRQASYSAPYIENCGLRCELHHGFLRFCSGDRVLFEEQSYPWSLHDGARIYKPNLGSDDFAATIKFNAYDGEIIHGMGQYRQARYDLKGCTLELSHRNSQISIPFFISNRGYGFLWNNPAIGTVTFAQNVTEWKVPSTKKIDYWVCADEQPANIIEKYTEVTGRATPLPDSLLGLWQCKLRYRTQDELMTVAREYHRRGIKLDVITIDFFHWIYQGDWDFDPEYWPDPQAMVDELKSMGIRLMVSVWPTVDPRSKNYRGFASNGYLVKTDRGLPVVFDFNGPERIYDATNPAAREFAYNILRENYGKYGIDMFWLDEAEPEYSIYDYDYYRYHIGPVMQTGNIYPRMHSEMVYDGLCADGKSDILNLVRCAWVGSPKYGALVWSGDIECSFREMKVQIKNGLNMGVAGIPWWISDTGGFYGGNINDPVFRELIARWYQWAVFTPILRMHGDRQPNIGALAHNTDRGGGFCSSGADNEIWSYGEENYEIFKKYLGIREEMKPYIRKTADEATATGLPMIRAMYLQFPDDENCWAADDQYMFGTSYLVAPVTEYGMRERRVYLPAGSWQAQDSGEIIESKGEFITAAAPLEYMPVYRKMN